MDLIDRQAAIDKMSEAIWHYPNELYPGLNVYTTARRLAEFGLNSVPSVQPKIIRCKDCKHWARTFGDDRWSVGDCDVFDKHLVMCKGYCAWAERRTDV